MPIVSRKLAELGHNIKMARMRRKITAVLFSERMGVTRTTLSRLENGDPKVSFGIYANALKGLGLIEDLSLVAKDDILGRKLQDIDMCGEFSEETSDKEIPKSSGKMRAAVAYRRAHLLGLVPEWLTVGEIKKIEELYEQAAEMSRRDGVSYHVDYIVPLCGTNKTGFHVLANLQILTATENLKKSNN